MPLVGETKGIFPDEEMWMGDKWVKIIHSEPIELRVEKLESEFKQLKEIMINSKEYDQLLAMKSMICDQLRLSDEVKKKITIQQLTTECMMAIDNGVATYYSAEKNPPKHPNHYLTKGINQVPCVLFYDGKNWGRTGRPDIPNDRVDAPTWWLPLPEDPIE